MIRFLIFRPIAVLMAFFAAVILGVVAYQVVPISLMPEIPISEIVVKLNYANKEARELEQLVVKPLRSELKQVMNLKDIQSETRNGSATLKLKFNYGSQLDYAFIEVNEKVDALMSHLPRDIIRPKVIKSSAADIPLYYLNLSLKNASLDEDGTTNAFIELSNFAEEVIRRRIEQLPEVAMVDVSGGVRTEIVIVPSIDKMRRYGISLNELAELLQRNNVEIGSIVVRNLQYEYNVQFASVLKGVKEIENVSFISGGKLMKIKDLATVQKRSKASNGSFLSNGKPAITFAVLKQANAKISGMQEKITCLIEELEANFPEVEFSVSQDQTQLLNLSIVSLTQNLKYGLIFIVLIVFIFLKDMRMPVIVGISLVVSIIISILLFYIVGLTINIISLAGVILAVGSMIDNSIVITDNISQYREKGDSIDEACINGTNELITPLLSSNLTNVAIFIPLIFLKGIGGELIYDEAIAVTIGLGISYITSVVLIPVIYRLGYKLPSTVGVFSIAQNKISKLHSTLLQQVNFIDRFYEVGFSVAFKYKISTLLFFLSLLPVGIISFWFIDKEKMPKLTQTEIYLNIDWNKDIHADENKKRTKDLIASFTPFKIQSDAYVGKQDFSLDNISDLLPSQSVIYIKAPNEEIIDSIHRRCLLFLAHNYPQSLVTTSPPSTIFEKIFNTSTPPLVAKISTSKMELNQYIQHASATCEALNSNPQIKSKNKLILQDRIVLNIDREKLLLYEVAYSTLIDELKTAFGNNQLTSLRSFQRYTPVVLSIKSIDVKQFLRTATVSNALGEQIRISTFITLSTTSNFKTIHSGKEGSYLPLNFWPESIEKQKYERIIFDLVKENKLDVVYGGALIESEEILSQMLYIIFISILLLYFILAAQFESFVTPILVLLELPIGFSGVILLLNIFGYSLNLMSLIGLLVMSGIVINDSILKIDSMNKLRAGGYSLLDSIHIGGQKRLRAIIMTSLTSISAFLPLLFTNDLGSELQKPFAYTLIIGLSLGTIISLYFVPICYYFTYRGQETKKTH